MNQVKIQRVWRQISKKTGFYILQQSLKFYKIKCIYTLYSTVLVVLQNNVYRYIYIYIYILYIIYIYIYTNCVNLQYRYVSGYVIQFALNTIIVIVLEVITDKAVVNLFIVYNIIHNCSVNEYFLFIQIWKCWSNFYSRNEFWNG